VTRCNGNEVIVSAMYSEIEVEIAEYIMTVTLDRPDNMNGITAIMVDELLDAFDSADSRDDVRVVIVTGRGRAFSAGAELAAGPDVFNHPHEESDSVRRDRGGEISLRIFDCKKPVIAAINGAAAGMGITMCLPMDIRIASSTAKFGFVFVRRGIVPESASSWFLPRVVGLGAALDWLVSGRLFGSDEALARGLVSRVVPPEELLETARGIAQEIATNASPVSVALTRQMVYHMLGSAHPMEANRVESYAMQIRGGQQDVKEGVQSFLEKRMPSFKSLVSTDLPDLGFQSPPYESWTHRS
jgi:enoyl-CoA hydratase/carnithine racemase